MTLISMIATDKFISIMSDGRVVNNFEDKKRERENFKKIIKVNNAIIAVGGNYKVAEIIFQHINKFNTKNAKTLANSLFEELGNQKVKKNMNILIGGLDDNGNIYYSGFDQNSTELPEYNPDKGWVTRLATESGESVEISNFDRLDQLIGNLNGISLNQAKTIQRNLNTLVNKIDRTVGTITFHEYIEK